MYLERNADRKALLIQAFATLVVVFSAKYYYLFSERVGKLRASNWQQLNIKVEDVAIRTKRSRLTGALWSGRSKVSWE